MKYLIFSLLFFSVAGCSEPRQEEEAGSSYNDFFMSRGERAKSVKEQNFSADPSASPALEEARIQEEQENLPDNVLEGIIPEEAQEEGQENMEEPRVNGDSETDYLKEQESDSNTHLRDETDY